MRNYFNLLILVFLLALIAFFGCKKKSAATSDLSGTYAVELNKTVKLPIGGNIATLTVVEVADSRCPVNANCVTSGAALVTVKFKDVSGEQTVELCLGSCFAVVKSVHSNGVDYYITLNNLLPYPTSTTASTSTATIILAKH